MAKGIDIKVDIISDPNGTAKVKREVDKLEKDVIASAKRVEANKKATARAIIQSDEAITRSATSSAKASANAMINELRRTETSVKQSANSIQGYLKSAFGGGMIGGAIGGFVGSLTASVTAGLAQLPSIFKTQLDEMVKIAAERQNAFKGLSSLSSFLGLSDKDTQSAVKNLRLVKAGVVDIATASTSLKNLLSSGFSLPEATKLLEAFSDTAAFGKSAALDFGEAIKGATEGIRNGNSILVDNVGLTKNLSAILKDAGFAEKDLSRVKDDLNVRQALFNGLLKEALPQLGDADKLTQGWTGSTSALSTAQDNLYAAIGDVIINNKELLSLVQTLTADINKQTAAVGNAETGWKKSINSMTSSFAEFVLSVRTGINAEIADFKELINYIELTGNRLGWLMTKSVDLFDVSGMVKYYGDAAAANAAKVGTFSRESNAQNKALTDYFNRQNVINLGVQPGYNPLYGRPQAPLGSSLNRPAMSGLMDIFTGKTGSSPSTLNAGGGDLPGSKTRGGRTRITKEDFQLSSQGKALIEAAERLGVDPIDLATIISYETSGKFSTGIKGGKGGNYQGLIQFGAAERQRYGVSGKQSFENQLLNSVVPFFQDRFRGVGRETYGASILDLYKTVNGGNPNVSSNASDGNGTIAQHVRNMLSTHRPKALNRFFGGSASNAGRDLPADLARALATDTSILSTGGPGISSDIDLSSREREIDLNNKLLGTYEELIRAMEGLNDMNREQEFLLDVRLGKYKDYTAEQIKDIQNTWKLIDAADEKKKAEAESTRQLEDFRQEQQRLFEDTARGWNDLLTDLSEGNFRSIWDNLRRSMLQQFIQPASQMLAQLFGNPMGGMQTAGGFGGQSGFNLGGIFGGGGGMGPGGTPMFNGNAGGGFNIGSLFGGQGGGFNIGSLFGSSSATSSGALGGSLGGLLGGGGGSGLKSGIRGMGGGSLLAGSAGLGGMAATLIGGAVGGKWGNFLSMTGMGTQIGAQFGPWGALIGGAIGAGAGLISMLFGRDNAEKKLKEAALSTYGITVKDKSVLKSLKQLGETMFGKGNVGKNAAQVVGSDEGQLILRNYAEASGQSSKGIDKLYIGDESWKGNQFTSKFGGFRALGGSVTAGMSYVVGERGPEVFTANQSGNITPNNAIGMSKEDRITMAGIAEALYMFTEKFGGISPGQLIQAGADENPEAFGRAVRTDNSNNLRSSEKFWRSAGAY